MARHYTTKNLLAIIFLLIHIIFLSSSSSSARVLARELNSKHTLMARLKLDQDADGPNSCWDSLFELKSCSGEVVLFFLNREAHLGTNCCRAIRYIERQCWPSMLGSLGITSQESDILRGYCDATVGSDSGSITSSPPPIEEDLHECYHLPRLGLGP